MLFGLFHRKSKAIEEISLMPEKLSVDTAGNRQEFSSEQQRYSATERNMDLYPLAIDTKRAHSIDSAVEDAIKFFKDSGWNTWKFKRPHAQDLRFGIVLDWPQYESHIEEQVGLLRKAVDKIGVKYDLASCGTQTIVAGGAFALYLGFKPLNLLQNWNYSV